MQDFKIPTRAEVSTNNQAIFDQLEKSLSFVPNIYAYLAKHDTALKDYLAYQNRKTTLSIKEKEVVNLAVSQVNNCRYCQSAHTVIGKMNGFSDEQILQIRNGEAPFDGKLDVLAQFAKAVAVGRGRISEELKSKFFSAGYNEANMIDVLLVISEITVGNYLHNLTGFEVDFPLAPELF